MAQIHTRKTKINGKNGVAVEITKRGKGERTADNTSLLELFTDFQTAQEDKGNSQKTIEFYLRGYFKLCDFMDTVYIKAPILRKMDFERVQFEKDIKDFSGGQKKKVLIAKSLCEKAHLYVWDEPLNFIDVYSRMQIEQLITEFAPTMLLVEHDSVFRDTVASKIVNI